MFFLSFIGFWLKAKNPRLTGNRGFLKIISVELEFHSHAAQKTAIALPNGSQASIDPRVHH
jgi:hypothetical protein